MQQSAWSILRTPEAKRFNTNQLRFFLHIQAHSETPTILLVIADLKQK